MQTLRLPPVRNKFPVRHLDGRAHAEPLGEVRVDRAARVIRGYVLAREGPFRSRRGEFDRESLQDIVRLTNAEPKGLRSRFGHPPMFGDALGTYLGRVRNAWLDTSGSVVRARADLHLAATVHPSGFDHGDYVARLAAEDPDALSTSLVLRYEELERRNSNGSRRVGTDGKTMPPLWRPTQLFVSDVVDTGDAVDGILDGNGSGFISPRVEDAASTVLDRFLANVDEKTAEDTLLRFTASYLKGRYPRSQTLGGVLAVYGLAGRGSVRVYGRRGETFAVPTLAAGAFAGRTAGAVAVLGMTDTVLGRVDDGSLRFSDTRAAIRFSLGCGSPAGQRLLSRRGPWTTSLDIEVLDGRSGGDPWSQYAGFLITAARLKAVRIAAVGDPLPDDPGFRGSATLAG